MVLIGMLDSPFVRRVAITMQVLGIDYQYRPLSIFESFEEFRSVHPLVKAPTLVCDDGEMLVDSTLIIDYLELLVGPEKSLMPKDASARRTALQQIGEALVAMEKVIQLVDEKTQRPADVQHEPWINRLEQQVISAAGLMEASVEAAIESGNDWLSGTDPMQADITTAVAWDFIRRVASSTVRSANHPYLIEYSERAEALPAFLACPP
ncbi:MAG: glutathione S-transferase family protein [Proteobacteria bacterium]|nr:glutathione S-transferase family protein [Pseudomonadota bacterium]